MSQPEIDKSHLTEYQREQLRSISYWTGKLDGQWSVMGASLGWDAILGLLPVAGDALTACVSLGLVNKARKMKAPKRLLLRMLGNIAVDFFGGALPLVGDLFDLAWHANTKNLQLLEQHYGIASSPGRAASQYSGLRIVLVAVFMLLASIFYFMHQQAIHDYFV